MLRVQDVYPGSRTTARKERGEKNSHQSAGRTLKRGSLTILANGPDPYVFGPSGSESFQQVYNKTTN